MADPKTDTVRDDQISPEAEILDSEIVEEEESELDNVIDEETNEEIIEEADERIDAEAAAKQVAEWQDKYMRLHAEWDTYRRRMNEQREEEKERAAEKLVEGLIPVMDDFERTIDYANQNGEAGLLSGIKAVHTKLADVLVREGVTIIDPAGSPYNALEAQAVGTVEDSNVPDETVSSVYQKGYRMGNKVIRPAMVTITTGGPKRETDDSPQDTDI